MRKPSTSSLILTLMLVSGSVFAATSPTPPPPPPPPAAKSAAPTPSKSPTAVQPLDGVNIEAVETYQNPKRQQLDFGLGMLPLDPYYNGFAIDLGYRKYFNKTWSWQILQADYIYSVDTDLRSQLAENFAKSPQSIERLTFIVASNVEYVMAYGKFVFAKNYIRYFRASVAAGPAYVTSNKRGTVGLNLGFRFETFVNENFSWVLQMRDIYAPSNISNNLMLGLGTAYGF